MAKRKFIEAAFLRPNHHQLQLRVEAHIFITVLACHLLCRVHEKPRDSGDVRDGKTVRRQLSTLSLATTRLPLADGRVLHIFKPNHSSVRWLGQRSDLR
ncbi:MAG: hypothetical protein MUF04_00180 [Akkermansiaceae bacterium]|nr:hypothetical protein [Akkermansiaceae bacterium]